ncbi:MAG: hypothetical protein NNA20_11580 [Nitrospira sp.]|nr:hypothetical protein [Nitrospira sp.]
MMRSTDYTFTQGLDYASIVTASENVAWTVDEIFRGRCFDASKPIVPASWVGTHRLEFLTDQEQRTLNHCRAFSYVHIFGNFEEFIPIHLTGIVEQHRHDDRTHLRALFRFGEEEMKHQQLFRRTETVLEQSCGHQFGRYFDDAKTRVTELANAILSYPPLPRFLILLALELGSQRHYVESVQDHTEEGGDQLYAEILKAHWVEEAQHTKANMLEIARLARTLSPEAMSTVFDQIIRIGGLVNDIIVGQVTQELDTLQQVTGRTFTDAEATTLRETLYGSLNRILCDVSLSHPGFVKVALELSKEGSAKLGFA